MTRPAGRSPGRRAPGVTVLEVVLALAVLTLVAGMTSGFIGLLNAYRGVEQVKLAGHEAAHRLIVQFNEDPRSVSRARYPVEVNGYWFEYEVEELVLRIDEFAGEGRVTPTRMSMADARDNITQALANPLWRVDVTVYARDAIGGYDPGQRVARLSRVYSLLNTDGDVLIQRLLDMAGEEIDRQ